MIIHFPQADYFMSWGKSAVRSFIERARMQKQIDAARAAVAAEVAARELANYNMKYRIGMVVIVLPTGFVIFLLFTFLISSKKNSGNARKH